MKRAGVGSVSIFAVIVGLAACSTFSSDEAAPTGPVGEAGSSDDAGSDAIRPVEGAPLIRVAVVGPPSVLVGERLTLTVSVTREGTEAFHGPVRIELAATPDITATAVEIAADQTTASLDAAIAAIRRHGRLSFVVKATSPGSAAAGSAIRSVLIGGLS